MRFSRFGVIGSLLCGIVFFLESAVYGQVSQPWQIEVVDSSRGQDAGAFSSLVIDRFGNFHLAYSNQSGTALRYAFRSKTEKRWAKTTVDAVGGSFETLAVDSHGWAHIAYNSPKSIGLHYALWDGKKWQKFLIDPAKTNRATSIQVDSRGYPRISYYREEYSDRQSAACLKYAYFDGKTWYTQTVDHRSGTGRWNSLVLDGNDRPYISYSIAASSLSFAYFGQSGWEHAIAGSRNPKVKASGDSDSSLQIGAGGEPHVAYINGTDRSVNYAWREGEVWHQETIDSLASIGGEVGQVSLKLDKNGRPHVIYYDAGRGALKYATRQDKEWHTETVENGDVGLYASLCLDQDDQPYVSYYAAADLELRIAHRQAADSVQKQ